MKTFLGLTLKQDIRITPKLLPNIVLFRETSILAANLPERNCFDLIRPLLLLCMGQKWKYWRLQWKVVLCVRICYHVMGCMNNDKVRFWMDSFGCNFATWATEPCFQLSTKHSSPKEINYLEADTSWQCEVAMTIFLLYCYRSYSVVMTN